MSYIDKINKLLVKAEKAKEEDKKKLEENYQEQLKKIINNISIKYDIPLDELTSYITTNNNEQVDSLENNLVLTKVIINKKQYYIDKKNIYKKSKSKKIKKVGTINKMGDYEFI
jgi:hypothetical protein